MNNVPQKLPQDALHSVRLYVAQVIPAVFNDNEHWSMRLWLEIVEHHVLCLPFKKQRLLDRILAVGRTLTLLTFMLFLVAVFFNISQPQDNGSCIQYTNQKDCLKSTSPFDYSQHYCIWSSDSADCSYNDQEISFLALFYLSILTTIITSISEIPIDYLFATLKAPTAKSLKGSKVAVAVNHVIDGARRLTLSPGVPISIPTTTIVNIPHKKSSIVSIATAQLKQLQHMTTIQGTDNIIMSAREIPDEVTELSDRARESLAVLKARSASMTAITTRLTQRLRMMSHRYSVKSKRLQLQKMNSDNLDIVRTVETIEGEGTDINDAVSLLKLICY